MFQGFLLILFWYLGVSKDKHNWFCGVWTRPKIPKSKKCGFWGSPISKSKKYYTELKQNNSPELLSLLFQ